MKRLAALAAIGLAGIGSAAAADMPGRMADDGLPFVPLFAWAGTHVGVNAGYGFAQNEAVPLCAGPAGTCPALALPPTDRGGFVGGGQVGYTLQVGRFVGGIEADAQYADVGGRVAAPGIAAAQRLDFLGTVRGRFGLAADRVMVYATGGFAYGDVALSQSLATAAPPALLSAARSRFEYGYAAGAGIEYGLVEAVTVRAEALYYDLGTTRLGAVSPATAAAASTRFTTEGIVARAGVNYKFNLF